MHDVKSAPPIDVLYLPTPSDSPLWEWICDFNRANPKDAIAFRGMDVWDRPWEHYARIRTLAAGVGIDRRVLEDMEKLCPASRFVILGRHRSRPRAGAERAALLSREGYEKCRAALTSLFKAAQQSGLDRQKKKDSAADDAFELAISASTLLGWLGFYNYNWSDDVLSWNARDEAQGRNTLLIMEKHAAARAIVAAHTSHVSHNRSRADWWGFGDIKSGIHFFTAMTRKKVFNIAFTAYEASGAQGQWLLPTAANSLDKKLHDAKHSFAFFTSDAAFLSEHPRWWIQNQNAGSYENGVELVPRDHFDAFIFLDRSHLDRALPARPMWEP